MKRRAKTESSPDASRPLTVGELTAGIRELLEAGFPSVWVEGELSGWTVAGSGHAYFSVKDERALLDCVMWRSSLNRLTWSPRVGDHVELRGSIGVYEPRGRYQLTVTRMTQAGQGELWRKFEELKARLTVEGLFAEDRKRPIPALPSSIGVVTSPTGAAIRDILTVLQRRAPGIRVIIYPARVQGDGAAAELASGIRWFSESGQVDVVIIGRGGGSMEDLWEFNDESLARAVAACTVPVISAVGHEVDFSICDFAADLRAATPSAAAEVVSAERGAVIERLRQLIPQLDRRADSLVGDARRRVQSALSSYALREPELRLRDAQQRLDDALADLDRALDDRADAVRRRLEAGSAALAGHDPSLILRKGYAIVRRDADGRLVSSARALDPGARLRLQFADGDAKAEVTQRDPGTALA